jgi:hypothetical protein
MKKWLGVCFGLGLVVGITLSRKRPARYQPNRPELLIGFPDEWAEFAGRNPEFVSVIPLLFDTMEAVFSRTFSLDLPDKVVYFLSKIATEDFVETFILSGNGHGIGAFKILRGMYERVVTAFFVAKNPDQAERFWNFFSIHKYKMIVHARRVIPRFDELLPTSELDATTTARDQVKGDYMDACDKCGAPRPLPSWIKGGMETMCKTTPELQQRYFHCYYWPTLHDHATPNNIIERVEIGSDDELQWKEDAQRGWADIAVSSAHALVLDVLGLCNTRFKLGLEARIQTLVEDWTRAWLKKPSPSA